MPVTIDRSETLSIVRMEGEVTIGSAGEFRDCLVQALASGHEVRVDLERAAEIDITALQLLWAAERGARERGVRFTLVGQLPQEIAAVAAVAGFEEFPVPLEWELKEMRERLNRA